MYSNRHETPGTESGPPSNAASPARERAVTIAVLAVTIGGTALVGLFSALRHEDHRASASVAAGPAAVSDAPAIPASPLDADRDRHDFGHVPIHGGVVETTFTLTNTGRQPTRVVATYTSCMCTTATLTFADGDTEGPFGMPGHDLPVTLDRQVAAGGRVTVTVRFDPAAHGPDATGPVERTIAVHTGDGASTTLAFTADVVKR